MEPRTIQITPQQALQITDSVLSQMIDWVRAKNGLNEHGKRNEEAVKSLFHSRLLLGVKHREMLMAAAKAQQTQQRRPIISREAVKMMQDSIGKWKGATPEAEAKAQADVKEMEKFLLSTQQEWKTNHTQNGTQPSSK